MQTDINFTRMTNAKSLVLTACFHLMIFSQLVKAESWDFDVFLDQTKIGSHTFKLDTNQVLTSHAKFNVKVLFVNAYQYEHTASEQWNADCLQQLTAKTTENKVVTVVRADSSTGNFKLVGYKSSDPFPNCVMSFAYWNPKMLEQTHLLNPQNAEYLNISTEKLPNETILVKSKSIQAMHYKIRAVKNGKSKLNIELWYTLKNEWVALKSITSDGYNITYKLR